MIRPALSHEGIEAQVDTALTGASMALADLGEGLLERGVQPREVGINHRLGMGEGILDVGRYLRARRETGEHVLVGACGVARIAGLLEIGAFLQQRR